MGDAGSGLACWSDCSGHGACQNGRCDCAQGWHGQTDLVSYEGYDCPMPRLAEVVAWSIAGVGAVMVTSRHVRALQAQLQAFQRLQKRANAKGKKLQWYNHVPLRIVALGLLTMCPLSLVMCAYKLAGIPNRRVGFDLVPSVAYWLVGFSGNTANVMQEIKTYEILVKSSSLGSKSGTDKVYEFMTTWYWRTLAAYGLGLGAAVTMGCFLPDAPPDKSSGPALLILRNVTSIAYLLALAMINREVALKIGAMIEVLSSQANKSAETSKVQAVLDFVESSARTKRKASISGTLILIVASLPPLWPYHGMFMVFLFCMGTVTTAHPVCNYLGKSNKRNNKVNTTQHYEGASFRAQSSALATSAMSSGTDEPPQ